MKKGHIRISIILASVYIVIFYAFTAGLINALLEGQNYNNIDGFIPSRAVQNNYETIIGILTLMFGFIGMVVMHRAYNAIKKKEKYIYLSIGLIIFTLAVTAMYKITELKMG
ncbi:MAG: hypothetical protein H0U27_11560 [Nitrosopumilus sp.]|nr:hypothetical protein [Nitrosopumilus sp.]